MAHALGLSLLSLATRRRDCAGFTEVVKGISVTYRCYRRQAFLGSARRRDLFLTILEETRIKYDFVVWGYVVMPEHFHLLISEPRTGSLSLAMQVLKQRVSPRCRRRRRVSNKMTLWQDPSVRASGRHGITISRKLKCSSSIIEFHPSPTPQPRRACPERSRGGGGTLDVVASAEGGPRGRLPRASIGGN